MTVEPLLSVRPPSTQNEPGEAADCQLTPLGTSVPPLVMVTRPVEGIPTAPPTVLPPSVAPVLTVTGPVPVAEFKIDVPSGGAVSYADRSVPIDRSVGRIEGAAADGRATGIPSWNWVAAIMLLPEPPADATFVSPRVSEPILVGASVSAMLPFEALICEFGPMTNWPIVALNTAASAAESLMVSMLGVPVEGPKFVTPAWQL